MTNLTSRARSVINKKRKSEDRSNLLDILKAFDCVEWSTQNTLV